jgi:erythromycin esterase
MARRMSTMETTRPVEGVEAELRAAALPLSSEDDLAPLIDQIGNARVVLIGEASHGTADFYTWRAALSRHLIEEHDFNFVAVEGDWPDCYGVNRFVKGLGDVRATARQVLHAFERWPTWMWANHEVADFAEWLRDLNASRPHERMTGFYGLDVYSLWESMSAVVEYLEGIDPEIASEARRAYACFEPYHEDAQEYARATAIVPTSCENEAVRMLMELRRNARRYSDEGPDAFFDAEQNALVARDAELYYRSMVRGGPSSWNVRDYHMSDTLDRLLKHHGPRSRAIVWEHNTHIGDARFTDMARAGMVNVGQLARQRHEGEGVVLIGFGSHRGSVIAAEEWGLPMQRMHVPEAREGSVEDLMHRSLGGQNALYLFANGDRTRPASLEVTLGHRAIGVVYDPNAERWGNYVPTILAGRYDAFLYIDESKALSPLHIEAVQNGELPETYPTGE